MHGPTNVENIFLSWLTTLLGLALFWEVARSHSHTPNSVELLWMRDQPDAETSTWQHTTLTRNRHPYPGWYSNPQSQQWAAGDPLIGPPDYSDRHWQIPKYGLKDWNNFNFVLLEMCKIYKVVQNSLNGNARISINWSWFARLYALLPLVMSTRKGRDSIFGRATRYGLDGPGIESRWGRVFPHTSRPALVPTQPPVQWVPGLSRG